MVIDTFGVNDSDPRQSASPSLVGKLVLLDGAKRDRDPYVGDIAVSGRSLYLTHNASEAVYNVIGDAADHQRSDGWIPPASINNYTLALMDYPLYWVLCSYDLFLYTGNTSYIQKYYSALQNVLNDYYPSITNSTTSLIDKNVGGASSYGDYAFLVHGSFPAPSLWSLLPFGTASGLNTIGILMNSSNILYFLILLSPSLVSLVVSHCLSHHLSLNLVVSGCLSLVVPCISRRLFGCLSLSLAVSRCLSLAVCLWSSLVSLVVSDCLSSCLPCLFVSLWVLSRRRHRPSRLSSTVVSIWVCVYLAVSTMESLYSSNPTPHDNARECMLDISWRCLNAPGGWVNPRFTAVAPTRPDLSSLFSSLGLRFCHGLLNIVQASEPPPVEWFETLPDQRLKNFWGIYVLVLRKDGHRAGLYIGSGTALGGVRTRIRQYYRPFPHTASSCVRKYIKWRYSIVHSSLLA
jgi:hypothetical protein